jgi:hypothetical protein
MPLALAPGGWEPTIMIVEGIEGVFQLSQIVFSLHPGKLLPENLHGGMQQAEYKSDYRDYVEKLDEREAARSVRGNVTNRFHFILRDEPLFSARRREQTARGLGRSEDSLRRVWPRSFSLFAEVSLRVILAEYLLE